MIKPKHFLTFKLTLSALYCNDRKKREKNKQIKIVSIYCACNRFEWKPQIAKYVWMLFYCWEYDSEVTIIFCWYGLQIGISEHISWLLLCHNLQRSQVQQSVYVNRIFLKSLEAKTPFQLNMRHCTEKSL